jgi:DNA-binding Xre family transcriptional regulator
MIKFNGFRTIFARKTLLLYHILKMYYMENKDLNRIKVVLADKKRTNKWLAEQLGKDPATISKWCTNSAQPNLENLMEIAKCLEVDVNELLRM